MSTRRRSTRLSNVEKTPGTKTPKASPKIRKTPGSGNRTTRAEEKTELQTLNTRLEVYINRQKQRNALDGNLQGDLDKIRSEGEAMLEALKKAHEAAIQAARRRRDDVSAENADLRESNARRTNQLKQLQNELRAQKKYKADLSKRVRKLEEELKTLEESLSVTTESMTTTSADLADVRKEKKKIMAELNNVRDLADNSKAELVAAQSKARNLEEDIALASTKAAQEKDQYEAQLADLSRDRSVVEEELRRDFREQMLDILAQRQIQFEEERDAGLADLQSMYTDKVDNYNGKLADLTKSITAEQRKLSELRKELREARGGDKGLAAETAELEKKIASAQSQIEVIRSMHKRQLAETVSSIGDLKSRIAKQEIDFEALMDVKISLAMEIKTYRLLLEDEENRLDYDADFSTSAGGGGGGGKRRKLVHTKESKYPEEESEEEEQFEETFEVDEESYDEEVIFVVGAIDAKKGLIEIESESKLEGGRTLDGWSIRKVGSRSKSFKFTSEGKLQTGDKIQVSIGSSKKRRQRQSWNISLAAGDEIQLIDPLGSVRDSHYV